MEKDILEKANYCLNCKMKPCSIKGCPLNNNIPEFIKELKEGNLEEAYKVLLRTTVFPGICGRICPHEKQCQGSCIRGIKGKPVQIGELEAYVFDNFKDDENFLYNCYEKEIKSRKTNKKVAIIGGGPAGLSCAAFLAREGIDVTIYEKHDYLGGLLSHGIPEFRLPRDIVKKTIKQILKLGIKVEYNKELGKNIKLEELESKYDCLFLAIGANRSSKMGIQGEELDGVFWGNELLEYNLHPNYLRKNVVVIGGGNVAIDCARTIKKLGAKNVSIIYRRAEEQMPAEKKEIDDAKNENIEFLFQTNIKKIFGETKVEKIELIKTSLQKKEGETRLVPVEIENSNYFMDVDYVVFAIGSKTEGYIDNLGLELDDYGKIKIDNSYRTSNPKVYSGGDLAGVKAKVAWAAKSGRDAAKNIIEMLNKE